jgi:hypothetical protein
VGIERKNYEGFEIRISEPLLRIIVNKEVLYGF